jgi:O-antigen/teichoic acid export membrane protein
MPRRFSLLWNRATQSRVFAVLWRGSLLSLMLNSVGYGVSYLLQLLFARSLGPHQFGLLSYAFAWIGIGLIVGKLGFDLALIRFVPEYQLKNRWGELRGLLFAGRWLPVAWGTGLALCAAAVTVTRVSAGVRGVALVACLLVPCGILLELNSSALRSMRHIGKSLIGDAVVRPALTAALLVGGGLVGLFRADGLVAISCYAVATMIVVIVGTWWLRRHVPGQALAVHRTYHIGAWLGASVPLMLAAGFQVLLYSVDTLMVAHYLGTTSAGFYSLASKVALLTLFAMNAAQVVAGPMMAEAFAGRDHRQLQHIAAITTGLSMLVAVPCAAGLHVFGAQVLGMFGNEFRSAAGALAILALAQTLNVATGPVGMLMSVGGFQWQLAGFLGLGVALNVLANAAWIPAYGLWGAAWAALVAQVIWNVSAVVFIRRRLAIDCTLLALLPRRSPAPAR